MVAVDDAPTAGGVPGELQRRLDGLGAAVAEVDPVEVRRRGEQPLGEQPGQRRRVELRQIGEIGVDDVVNRLADDRMVPAEGEYPEAGEHVEVLDAVLVVEVRPCGAGVELVEPDRVQHARQLWVHVPALQRRNVPARAARNTSVRSN